MKASPHHSQKREKRNHGGVAWDVGVLPMPDASEAKTLGTPLPNQSKKKKRSLIRNPEKNKKFCD